MSDPNIKADPSASYQLLRNETATMLKLGDVDALGLVEGLQLDLVSLLRLEVDGLEGQVLAGQPVDLAADVGAYHAAPAVAHAGARCFPTIA
jgi:hypothetical protein